MQRIHRPWKSLLAILGCARLLASCTGPLEIPEPFQFGIGNKNVFPGQVELSAEFPGRKVLVTDVMVIQSLQPGPVGTVRFWLSEYDAITDSYSMRFSYRFETISEQIHFSSGVVFEDRIRFYNHGLSANPVAFEVLGIYLPDEL